MSEINTQLENGIPVVYGLCDPNGLIYYVGQTRKFKERMATYRRLDCHRNQKLEDKIKQNGLNWILLSISPRNLNNEEAKFIAKYKGLVNIYIDLENLPYQGKEAWQVVGVKCPSAVYRIVMRNKFKDKTSWPKEELSKMDSQARLRYEMKMCETLLKTESKNKAILWLKGLEVA